MTTEHKQEERRGGWSKGFPTVDGDYWLRFADPRSESSLVEVNRRGVFEAGVTGDVRNRVVFDECEWLGPISPSDTEELIALREAGSVALEWIAVQAETWTCQHGDEPMRCSRCSLRLKAKEITAQLRKALKKE